MKLTQYEFLEDTYISACQCLHVADLVRKMASLQGDKAYLVTLSWIAILPPESPKGTSGGVANQVPRYLGVE
jgi:hypothetical protein